MGQFYALPTTHVSVPNTAWTKVSAVKAKDRRYLYVQNDDAAATFRITIANTIPLAATDGFELLKTDYRMWGGTELPLGDLYAYQSSGGALVTLAVQEGT